MNRVVLSVAMGPHIHDGSHVYRIMAGYVAALMPAAVWGCVHYGMPAVRTLLLAVGSAVVWEGLARRFLGRDQTIHDGSALVQGLLMGMMLPANTPWWLIIVGTFLMIFIGKQLFGGIGCYPLNPVLIGYAILSVSWPMRLSSHFALVDLTLKGPVLEPLAALKSYGPSVAEVYPPLNLLLGLQTGGIGTGAVGLLALGGIFLMARGDISWRVSLSFLLGVAVAASIFHVISPSRFAGAAFHILAGTTVFGAFFLASDYTTTPVYPLPRLIYGFGTGVLIVLIRNLGAYPDGTVFGILILNLFHPLIDRIRPSVVGGGVLRSGWRGCSPHQVRSSRSPHM